MEIYQCIEGCCCENPDITVNRSGDEICRNCGTVISKIFTTDLHPNFNSTYSYYVPRYSDGWTKPILGTDERKTFYSGEYKNKYTKMFNLQKTINLENKVKSTTLICLMKIAEQIYDRLSQKFLIQKQCLFDTQKLLRKIFITKRQLISNKNRNQIVSAIFFITTRKFNIEINEKDIANAISQVDECIGIPLKIFGFKSDENIIFDKNDYKTIKSIASKCLPNLKKFESELHNAGIDYDYSRKDKNEKSINNSMFNFSRFYPIDIFDVFRYYIYSKDISFYNRDSLTIEEKKIVIDLCVKLYDICKKKQCGSPDSVIVPVLIKIALMILFSNHAKPFASHENSVLTQCATYLGIDLLTKNSKYKKIKYERYSKRFYNNVFIIDLKPIMHEFVKSVEPKVKGFYSIANNHYVVVENSLFSKLNGEGKYTEIPIDKIKDYLINKIDNNEHIDENGIGLIVYHLLTDVRLISNGKINTSIFDLNEKLSYFVDYKFNLKPVEKKRSVSSITVRGEFKINESDLKEILIRENRYQKSVITIKRKIKNGNYTVESVDLSTFENIINFIQNKTFLEKELISFADRRIIKPIIRFLEFAKIVSKTDDQYNCNMDFDGINDVLYKLVCRALH